MHAILLAITLLAAACQQVSPPPSRNTAGQKLLTRNIGVELSEDAGTDRALESALVGFLKQAERGEYKPNRVAPEHLAKHRFFFDGLTTTRRSRNASVVIQPAAVLKSYSFDEQSYYITLAYHGTRNHEPFIRKIAQLKAVPFEGSYQFECLFDERTAQLAITKVGNVTFRHAHTIEQAEADRFVAFRDSFCARTNATKRPLTYYSFASLEQMLRAYGIDFDCNKCNFLSNDLGFGDDGGARFVTGMASVSNIRDYIYAHFKFSCPDPEQMYSPVKEGIAVCYDKTWGDVTVAQMNEKFRRELRDHPDTNFLDEFRKARKASVDSHFTHYYLCALLCNELIANDRLDQALELLYSGHDGERFFATLHSVLGINEANFHQSVVRLMHTPNGPPRSNSDQ